MNTDKIGILDVRAIIDGKINCDIEVQVVDQRNIEKRILFYWSKLYIDSIKEGNDYNKLKKTIIVLILDYNLEKLSKIPVNAIRLDIRKPKFNSSEDEIAFYSSEQGNLYKRSEKIKELQSHIKLKDNITYEMFD